MRVNACNCKVYKSAMQSISSRSEMDVCSPLHLKKKVEATHPGGGRLGAGMGLNPVMQIRDWLG